MSNRRDFLKQTTAFAAGMSLLQGAEQNSPEWYGRPMRWFQLAFVEDDPGNYNPQMWLDYFRRIHADAACLSAGGCVAFYPTKVPLHYRSKFLGDRDIFGEMLAGCRKMGMNVIARTDPHACHQDVYDKHPEWIAVDAQGNKRRHWADPELWVTCALGGYNFEFMTDVTIEIVREYKVDGIFSNRWAGSGMCFCNTCQKLFRDYSGHDLPHTTDPQDPVRRQYLNWHEERLFDLWRLWDTEIRKINPNAAYLANAGGGALSELDMKTIGSLAPTLFADRQARHGLMAPWAAGKNAKEYAATLGDKAIAGITSVGLEEAPRWKDSVQTSDEIRLWLADGVAHNLRPWIVKFNARPIDRRWMQPVEDFYNWHFHNERYLRNEGSLSEVAIVYSQQSAAYYGRQVEDHALGYYQALVEGRVPFDMVHDLLLDEDHVSRYRVLILPNIAALSDRQCEQLTRYVENGGSIVATYETSLCDEWGKRRNDFGLAALFGASYDGKVDRKIQNSYIDVHGPHALLRGLENAPRIVNGTNWVHVRATVPVKENPLTLVPSYPDLPMEEVYARVPHTDTPAVFLRTHGKGRVAYFPADLDRTFWEYLANDQGIVLRNAAAWAHGGPQPLTVTGKGLLDVSLWKQKNSVTAHLVNLTNPMALKGPLRELIPSQPQKVRVRIPSGRQVKSVKLLSNGAVARYRTVNGAIEVDVPPFELNEAVAIDLA
ncbi:MAG: beta-galactosidase trimerization domain-containing protein [Acidobacteriota bacterium]|nr:beta-galactosidase trimerization domain-containing protein [Acidobacteriota bacterium]